MFFKRFGEVGGGTGGPVWRRLALTPNPPRRVKDVSEIGLGVGSLRASTENSYLSFSYREQYGLEKSICSLKKNKK